MSQKKADDKPGVDITVRIDEAVAILLRTVAKEKDMTEADFVRYALVEQLWNYKETIGRLRRLANPAIGEMKGLPPREGKT